MTDNYEYSSWINISEKHYCFSFCRCFLENMANVCYCHRFHCDLLQCIKKWEKIQLENTEMQHILSFYFHQCLFLSSIFQSKWKSVFDVRMCSHVFSVHVHFHELCSFLLGWKESKVHHFFMANYTISTRCISSFYLRTQINQLLFVINDDRFKM